MYITKLSIKHSLTVYVLMFILIIFGVATYLSIPRESFPEVKIPYIFVSTVYPGVSPEDIESLVTQKIEKEIKGISDIEEITSFSNEGYSTIAVEFEPDVDLDTALQKVRDRVDLAKPELPEDAEDPLITEFNVSDIPIMIVNIAGDCGLVKLKQIAEDFKDEIETVRGVLAANIVGGLEREVQVNVDPRRLNYYQLSFQDIVDTIKAENLTMPGGNIDIGRLKNLIRVPGEIERPDQIKHFVLKSAGGQAVYIRDVADVLYDFKDRTSISRLNGKESVSISIQKRTGENIIRITDEIKGTLKELEEKCPAGTQISIIADLSRDIRLMVRELENNIISGFILIVAVLMIVMGIRNSLFVATAIPLSLLITFICLFFIGYTMNMVVLFSLILVVGMLVDNAIVIVENIYRHREEGEKEREAALNGTSEVAVPVISSTVTTLVAFAPMYFWPGIVGDFMSYLPVTLIISLTASLFVALVMNPVICANMMRINPKKLKIERLKHGLFYSHYRQFLTFIINTRKHRVLTLLIMFGLLILTFIAYGFWGLGVEFFPDVEPNNIFIRVDAPAGTNLEASDGIVKKIETKVIDTPDMENFISNIGTQGDIISIGPATGEATNKSQIIIDLHNQEDRKQSSFKTLERLREEMKDIGGAEIETVKEEQGPPTGPPVNIDIAGDDFDVLVRLSNEIKEKIKDIPGLVNLRDNYDEGKPEIHVKVDRILATFAGLNTEKVANAIRTAINGTEASKYRVGEDEYDITVRLSPESRKNLEDLKSLTIANQETGFQIPITALAEIKIGVGPSTIIRKNLKRVITVQADVVKTKGRTENTIRNEAMEILKDFPLPPGYRISFTGQNEEQEESEKFITWAFWIAILLIALVLITQFDSLILPLTIMISVILSLIGVLWGLIITRTPFGIVMTGIGVISLAGVVVNNAIVLCDFIVQLRQRGYPKIDAIVEAGVIRLRPVMLTAVTTVLGLIPLTTGISFDFIDFKWTINGESSQWWGPMGVAVIFGLSFATILTLVVVPITYYMLDSVSERLKRFLKI
ncbi:MAG: efflux RND transporter permease subunit [Acidobacteriota bacterium]